ncbi:putative protein of unknown function DUF262 [Lyophyllum shimeji]|uniref:GmrSD restriction endonucleases N-terminal domain-containing protein n=1 Tax=Lyophyllum shimeji TaxID=47721 RepID=A0A9P3UT05_LYOSH|nr:putative protein of unknown function DUF262 [Lyophyllum shimeji]
MASDDDYSELTDLDDDDYAAAPSSSKRRKRASSPSGKGGFCIKRALKKPRATTYTAQALYDQMHSDDIKLDPEYQRDVVWPDTKMVGLIDSVFRNFYVPPVIFAVVSFEDGTEKKICIDGKQRLTSIQRFMDGLIPHKDPESGEKWWYRDTGAGGKTRRKVLPERFRRIFQDKQVVCVEYQDVTEDDEREIFQRVQLGMALTPAGQSRSPSPSTFSPLINTPRATFVRSLLTHFFSPLPSSSGTSSPSLAHAGPPGSLASLDFDRARGADFRCLAQLVFCLHTPLAQLNGAGALAKLEKFLSEPARFRPEFEGRVVDALRVVGEMAGGRAGKEEQDRDREERERVGAVFRSPAKLAPVEFVMVGVLVATHMGAVGFGGKEGGGKGRDWGDKGKEREREGRRRLAEGIRRMREDVREHHVDIRMNDRVARTMVEFIRRWKPDSAVVGPGKRKRAAEKEKQKEEEKEEGEVPDEPAKPRTKFKKVSPPSGAAAPLPAVPSPATTTTTTTPKPASLPPKPQPLPAPRTDRLAALRAVKMQAQQATPPPPPPYPSAPAPAPAPAPSYPSMQMQMPAYVPSQGGYIPAPSPTQPQAQGAGFQSTMPYPHPPQHLPHQQQHQQQYNLEMGLMGGQRRAGGGGPWGAAGRGGGGGWGGSRPGSASASGGGGGGGVSGWIV